MNHRVGIEKIRVSPGHVTLDLAELCAARGLDEHLTRSTYLTDQRAILTPWEDTVTMAVNAAAPMLTEADRASIGLLIVATETAIDQEKPVSSWVHGLLGLPSDCRNFEVKFACYAGTAALQMAQAWLLSGLAGDRKALIICADASMPSLNEPYEPVTGSGACAILVSSAPRLVEYEVGRNGIYATDVTDIIRPTPKLEVGNGEHSLFQYIEAAVATFAAYQKNCPEARDFGTWFDRNLYHVPFGAITFRAHRALLTEYSQTPPSAIRADFDRKVLPSLTYDRRMGGTYSASTFIALLGLCDTAKDLHAGDRVGIFAFGSGSCAEYYSAKIAQEFRETARAAGMPALLDARRRLSITEYEQFEHLRHDTIGLRDFAPDRREPGGAFETHFAGRRILVLDRVENHHRHYVWS